MCKKTVRKWYSLFYVFTNGTKYLQLNKSYIRYNKEKYRKWIYKYDYDCTKLFVRQGVNRIVQTKNKY